MYIPLSGIEGTLESDWVALVHSWGREVKRLGPKCFARAISADSAP